MITYLSLLKPREIRLPGFHLFLILLRPCLWDVGLERRHGWIFGAFLVVLQVVRARQQWLIKSDELGEILSAGGPLLTLLVFLGEAMVDVEVLHQSAKRSVLDTLLALIEYVQFSQTNLVQTHCVQGRPRFWLVLRGSCDRHLLCSAEEFSESNLWGAVLCMVSETRKPWGGNLTGSKVMYSSPSSSPFCTLF